MNMIFSSIKMADGPFSGFPQQQRDPSVIYELTVDQVEFIAKQASVGAVNNYRNNLSAQVAASELLRVAGQERLVDSPVALMYAMRALRRHFSEAAINAYGNAISREIVGILTDTLLQVGSAIVESSEEGDIANIEDALEALD